MTTEQTLEDPLAESKAVGENFLEHYGVKGMRWGVRKTPDPERSASRWKARKDREREAQGKENKFKKANEDRKAKAAEKKAKTDDDDAATKTPKAKRLSEQELRDSIARMQLEKQYNDLVMQTTPKRKMKKGEAFVKEAKEVGATAVKKAATDVGTQLAASYMREALGLPNPKKKK